MGAKILVTTVFLTGLAAFVWAQAGQSGQTDQQTVQPQGGADQGSDQSGTDRSTQDHSRMSGMTDRGQAAADMPAKTPDQHFLKCSIQNDMFEQEFAQLVSKKVQDSNVKQLAQKISEDHRSHLDQVKQVAQNVRDFQAPQQMASWQQAKLQSLSRLDPSILEQVFLIDNIAGHQRAILENKVAASKSQDTQIKTLATRTISQLQQHLQQANQVSEQVLGVRADTGIGVSGR